MILRWYTFLRERHEPVSVTVMVLAFAGADAMMARIIEPASFIYSPGHFLGGFFLLWLVFLHMRLFDEVKDYVTDCEVNRDRPLPRGLISPGEFGAVTMLVIMLEILTAIILGKAVFLTYTVLLAFTLLMRMEFFIGDWLRPKLELYAISHTFSAGLMGALIYAIVTDRPITEISFPYFWIMAGNWFVFNVFEFGRKTFGREEEREGVDSYSSRLGSHGAFWLLAVNLFLAYYSLYRVCDFVIREKNISSPGHSFGALLMPTAMLTLMVVAAGMAYAMKPSGFFAKLYRGTVTFYLLAYHTAIIIGGYACLPG